MNDFHAFPTEFFFWPTYQPLKILSCFRKQNNSFSFIYDHKIYLCYLDPVFHSDRMNQVLEVGVMVYVY